MPEVEVGEPAVAAVRVDDPDGERRRRDGEHDEHQLPVARAVRGSPGRVRVFSGDPAGVHDGEEEQHTDEPELTGCRRSGSVPG
jgi:hypothetical protein